MTLQKLSEMLLVFLFSHGDQTKKFRRINQNYFRLSRSSMTAIEVNIRLSLIENLTIMQNETTTPKNIFVGSIFTEHPAFFTCFTLPTGPRFPKKSVGPTCEASMRKSCQNRWWTDGCWDGDHSQVEDSSGAQISNSQYIRVILLSTANIL